MPVDLHLHSTCSDGTDDPATLVALAARAGLGAMALTDHDTLEGIAEARDACARAGIGFVPGVELSIEVPDGRMHMLVYFLEPGEGPLQDELGSLRSAREVRNAEIVDRLSGMGLDVSLDAVLAEAGGGVVGRPHIAAVLVANGHATDIKDAFDRWLAEGRPGYVPRRRLDAVTAIRLARKSGAVPVVAHPHTLAVSADGYRRAFTELAALGMQGIECHYAEYTPAVRNHLAGIARDLDMVATGGTDYHGRYKPGLSVGTGRGDLQVPDEVVDQLSARRSG